MAAPHKLATLVHQKARRSPYQGGGPERQPLQDEQVPWQTPFPGYAPVDYTAKVVAAGPVWADKPDQIKGMKFNALDGKLNRKSHEPDYVVDADGFPRNPHGRTGMVGRGLLGRFGPNHAADPIVTRWRRDEAGKVVQDTTDNPVLEFVAVQRKDNGEWAIPGGMVDAGSTVSATLKREFGEEAMNSLEATPAEKKEIKKLVDKTLATRNGCVVYKGYVDDPRNTDHSWMETVAMNFHDETGESMGKFKLHGGDDAGEACWAAISPGMPLFASHSDMIGQVRRFRLNARAVKLAQGAKSLSVPEALAAAFSEALAAAKTVHLLVDLLDGPADKPLPADAVLDSRQEHFQVAAIVKALEAAGKKLLVVAMRPDPALSALGVEPRILKSLSELKHCDLFLSYGVHPDLLFWQPMGSPELATFSEKVATFSHYGDAHRFTLPYAFHDLDPLAAALHVTPADVAAVQKAAESPGKRPASAAAAAPRKKSRTSTS